MYINIYICMPPKNGQIALWLNTNRSSLYILVLAGCESIFTDIIEYTFFSVTETRRELQYKDE